MLFFLILFICVYAQENTTWMGVLELHLLPDGGSFTMKGYTNRDTWIPLPGEHGTWPYSVRDQEEHLLVIDREGIPHAQLKKGEHLITGIFSWSKIPHHIKTPMNIGIVSATSNNQSTSVYRTPKRTWFSSESLPKQTHRIQKTQALDHIEYTIFSQGLEQPVHLPLPTPYKGMLQTIETSSAYWLQNNTLHMQLPQGEHTVKLSLQTNEQQKVNAYTLLSLDRIIEADTESLVITDTWNGVREENLLLYSNSTNHLPKGYQKISITHSQLHDSPIAPLITEQNIEDYTVRVRHPGYIRIFEQWPFPSIGLWILSALMLWKKEQFQKRRLLLLSTLLCVILSPIALIFCLCWIASSDSFSSSTEESQNPRALAIFGIFAGIIMYSISPSTIHTTDLEQITPEFYWINGPTIFSLATIAIALFALVAYRNIQTFLLLFFCWSLVSCGRS